MRLPKNTFYVNCIRLDFNNALGVTRYVLRLARALSEVGRVVIVTDDEVDVRQSTAWRDSGFAEAEVTPRARLGDVGRGGRQGEVEVVCHHFQDPIFPLPSIGIVFDLHVFDVPWKYPNPDQVQAEFKTRVQSYDVVLAPFLRTYFDLEAVLSTPVQNLYYCNPPLLIDEQIGVKNADIRKDRDSFTIFYPAQFQRHKGHRQMIDALALYNSTRPKQSVKYKFCGSDFRPEITAELKAYAVSRGVGSAVEFMGRISEAELISNYQSCNAVMVPSEAEGGAYVALEGIAAGRPVAYNRLRAAKLHMEAFRASGIEFDVSDVGSIAKAICGLLEHRNSDQSEAKERLKRATWSDAAEIVYEISEWLSKRRLRPILKMDPQGWVTGIE